MIGGSALLALVIGAIFLRTERDALKAELDETQKKAIERGSKLINANQEIDRLTAELAKVKGENEARTDIATADASLSLLRMLWQSKIAHAENDPRADELRAFMKKREEVYQRQKDEARQFLKDLSPTPPKDPAK